MLYKKAFTLIILGGQIAFFFFSTIKEGHPISTTPQTVATENIKINIPQNPRTYMVFIRRKILVFCMKIHRVCFNDAGTML